MNAMHFVCVPLHATSLVRIHRSRWNLTLVIQRVRSLAAALVDRPHSHLSTTTLILAHQDREEAQAVWCLSVSRLLKDDKSV